MGMFDLQITRNFSAQILTRIIHVWFAIIFGNFFPPKSLILWIFCSRHMLTGENLCYGTKLVIAVH